MIFRKSLVSIYFAKIHCMPTLQLPLPSFNLNSWIMAVLKQMMRQLATNVNQWDISKGSAENESKLKELEELCKDVEQYKVDVTDEIMLGKQTLDECLVSVFKHFIHNDMCNWKHEDCPAIEKFDSEAMQEALKAAVEDKFTNELRRLCLEESHFGNVFNPVYERFHAKCKSMRNQLEKLENDLLFSTTMSAEERQAYNKAILAQSRIQESDPIPTEDKVMWGLTLAAAVPIGIAGIAMALALAPIAIPVYFLKKSIEKKITKDRYENNRVLVLEEISQGLSKEWAENDYAIVKDRVSSFTEQLTKQRVMDPLLSMVSRLLNKIKHQINMLRILPQERINHAEHVVGLRKACKDFLGKTNEALTRLLVFEFDNLFEFDVPVETLSWKPGISTSYDGAFGKVYIVKQTAHGKTREVAVKEFYRVPDTRDSEIDFVTEDKNLRYWTFLIILNYRIRITMFKEREWHSLDLASLSLIHLFLPTYISLSASV